MASKVLSCHLFRRQRVTCLLKPKVLTCFVRSKQYPISQILITRSWKCIESYVREGESYWLIRIIVPWMSNVLIFLPRSLSGLINVADIGCTQENFHIRRDGFGGLRSEENWIEGLRISGVSMFCHPRSRNAGDSGFFRDFQWQEE